MSYYNTIKRYSFLWSRYNGAEPPEKYHFDAMQEVVSDRIVRGATGLDLGCGCGFDTFIMAGKNSSVRIIGMDVSEGVNSAFKLNKQLKNATIIRGSASRIPLKNETCDFVYSFGVLHHMDDYKNGISEIGRVLRKKSPVFLYLYEDHADNLLKYAAIKIVNVIRGITVKIPPKTLYTLSCFLSPLLVLLFSYPAKIFRKYKSTYRLYEKMPFNFGDSLFSLTGDIYDRLAAPVETRFGRKELYKIFTDFNFTDVRLTKLKATAGWVVQAYKKG